MSWPSCFQWAGRESHGQLIVHFTNAGDGEESIDDGSDRNEMEW
jgi:hypothetical protein